MKKLILIPILVMSGCGWLTTTPNVIIKAESINTCNNPPKADILIMRDVEPIVIQDRFDIVFIGITPRHYENLSLNMQGLLTHMRQQNAIIEYYKNCYATPK